MINYLKPKKTVLVVDDSPIFRKMACDVLIAAGYKVVEARNDSEARKCLRDKFYVIVCDNNMGERGDEGCQLLGEVKQGKGPNRDTPFIINTSDDSREIATRVAGLGGYYHWKHDNDVVIAAFIQIIMQRLHPQAR